MMVIIATRNIKDNPKMLFEACYRQHFYQGRGFVFGFFGVFVCVCVFRGRYSFHLSIPRPLRYWVLRVVTNRFDHNRKSIRLPNIIISYSVFNDILVSHCI